MRRLIGMDFEFAHLPCPVAERVHDAGDHGRALDNDGGPAAELLSKTGHAIPVGLEA